MNFKSATPQREEASFNNCVTMVSGNPQSHQTEVCIWPLKETLDSRRKYHELAQVTVQLSSEQNVPDEYANLLDFDKQLILTLGLCMTTYERAIEHRLLYSTINTHTFECTIHVEKASKQFVESEMTSDEVDSRQDICESHDILTLQFKILSVIHTPAIFEMSTEEKFELAGQFKALGTELFRSGHTDLAFQKYKRALKYLILIRNAIPTELADRDCDFKQLIVQCYLNMAACQGRKDAWLFVVENCTKALKIKENNFKALFRRASALERLQRWEEALTDWQLAETLDPSQNATVQKHVTNIRARLRQQSSALAQGLSKMFSS